jgi:hypothetical protein
LGDGVYQGRSLFRGSDQDPPFEADLIRFDLDLDLQQWEVISRSRLAHIGLQTFANWGGAA